MATATLVSGSHHVAARSLLRKTAIVVSCHKAYLHYLAELIPQVDAQGAGLKILAYDGVLGDLDDFRREHPDWQVVQGIWGGPATGRNGGLEIARRQFCDYIVYFDADNFMPAGYVVSLLEAMQEGGRACAIAYPRIEYLYASGKRWQVDISEWDHLLLTERNYVDTASCWRTHALSEVGGWKVYDCTEDWDLALRVAERGYVGKRADVTLTMRQGHPNRTAASWKDIDRRMNTYWQQRRVAIVSLLAGRKATFGKWREWIQKADLPRRCSLYVVDNSRNERFGKNLRRFLEHQEVAIRFEHVEIITRTAAPKSASQGDVFRHIGRLYNETFRALGNESLVLTLEDDMEPPLDGLRTLHDRMAGAGQGAVAALYASPDNNGVACAAVGMEKWSGSPLLAEARGQVRQVGFVGGGFTLYNARALKRALPLETRTEPELWGWDADLSYRMRQLGYEVWLDGEVECKHHVHGVVAR